MVKFKIRFQSRSLVELSQVEICKQMWTHSHIKRGMKFKLNNFIERAEFLETLNLSNCDPDSKLVDAIDNKIDKLPIPPILKCDIKAIAKKMEFVIWDWLQETYYGHTILADLASHIDYIVWSQEGDIDTVKTLQSIYFSRILPDDKHTWDNLSKYCLEECLVDFFERLTPLNYVYRELNSLDILPLYWIHKMQNDLEDFFAMMEDVFIFDDFYETSESLEVNLLRYSLAEQNHLAAMYFWNISTDDQRIRTMSKIVEKNLKLAALTGVFFWKQAGTYQIDSFIMSMLGQKMVMRRLIQWPYEHLFLETLEESDPQLEYSDLQKMAIIVYHTMVSDPWNIENYYQYQRLFLKIWPGIGEKRRKAVS